MKCYGYLLVLFLFATTISTDAQEFLLVSLRRTSFSQVTGEMANHCVLVQADGSVRREHESMDLSGNKWADIYEGRLAPTDLETLIAAISTSEFKAIESTPPAGSLRMVTGDMIDINILRPGSVQNMHFVDPNARKPHEKTLKPLLAWWKSVEKLKLQKIKDATSTGCQPGQKMFEKALNRRDPQH